MAQVDMNYKLDYDDISEFLSKTDEEWMFDLSPPDQVDTISPRNKVIHSKKPRRYQRLDIVNTRQELAKLELHLQILQEKHEFYESLKATKSNCGLDWRLFASREQMLAKKATQVRADLLKRVNDNGRLIERIRRLIQRQQIASNPVTFCSSFRVVSLDNEANVRRALQMCLDHRSKYQLDSIVKQYGDGEFDVTSRELELTQWNTFAFGDQGAGVEFHESVVLPFSTAHIKDAINEWPSANSSNHTSRSGIEQDQSEPLHDDLAESGRLLILRRLFHVNHLTVILWEDAFCYQSIHDSSCVKAMVRSSAWALISPLQNDDNCVSIVISGGFVLVHTTDRTSLQITDDLVTDTVAYTQRLQRSRMTRLEDILIDSLHPQ